METFHQKIFCIIYAPPKIFINIIHCPPHQVETRRRGWTSKCHKFCWLRKGFHLTSLDNVKKMIRYFHLRNEFYLLELENRPLREPWLSTHPWPSDDLDRYLNFPPSKRTPLCRAQHICPRLSSSIKVTAFATNEPPDHLAHFFRPHKRSPHIVYPILSLCMPISGILNFTL